MTLKEFVVLRAVKILDPAAEVADKIRIAGETVSPTPQQVGSTLKALSRRGLVRSEDNGDGKLWSITQKGKRVLDS